MKQKFALVINNRGFHIVNSTAPADLQPCIVQTCATLSEAVKTIGVINYCAQVDEEIKERARNKPVNRFPWWVPCLN